MRPKGLALNHPGASLLKEYATFGCLTQTGKQWTKAKMWEAVAEGPHWSELLPEAIKHFRLKSIAKVVAEQAILLQWDGIKDDPPLQLKISPIVAIPHKSKVFCSILDLLFTLRLLNGSKLPSVNDTTIKTAPSGAINQLGHLLSQIIHAFAKADNKDKIFIAKWDIKDGFWCMDCREGKQWNFAYVLPLVGKSAWNFADFCNYSNSGPFELRNFHRNFIFPIVKCVSANSEHVPTGLESSPAIDSSHFMNRKMFQPSFF
jgi:hypothetical protein